VEQQGTERKRASRCVEKMSMATFIWERGHQPLEGASTSPLFMVVLISLFMEW
jgi:hypothetical protein